MKKVLFIGGCFTTQHNVEPEERYHFLLGEMAMNAGVELAIQTYRYEQFNDLKGQINKVFNDTNHDVVFFHLRSEPTYRMQKLLNYYIDNQKKKIGFNFGFLSIYKNEQYHFMQSFNQHKNATNWIKEKLKKGLVFCNYAFGFLVGNHYFAQRYTMKKIDDLYLNCVKNNQVFVLISPVIRPKSWIENRVAIQVHQRFERYANKNNILYINIMQTKTESGESMFFEDKMYVSKAGHKHVALKILKYFTQKDNYKNDK
jgi:hypothetical protein